MITESKIIRDFRLPRAGSHKGDNGRLLIIAGSAQFHGSLVYAVKIASRIVDLIYVLTTKDNTEVIRKLKVHTAEFIPVRELKSYLNYVDCVLIGPGMGISRHAYKLVEQVLRSRVRAVLDADALNVLDERLKGLLGKNHILTPHAKEFERVFGIAGNRSIEQKSAMKFGCTIVLKGKADIIAGPDGKIYMNRTGNEGMTKGGTGDVLAGLIAGFFCANEAFFSAVAGAYLNGLAGDQLFKKVGPFYNAEDLVNQIPKTLWKILK